MEFEYWWLLGFPVFFCMGWLASRVDIKHVLIESRRLPSAYFKGLNFLLNEQPDRAIESFLDVATNDRETIELHFTLGNLFRRRGEMERAIRLHQSLLERGDLDDESRLKALAELGQDFLKAGLLDRAEEVFGRLRSTTMHAAALSALMQIYQQEKEWEKAISIARELKVADSVDRKREVANYYCELAVEHISNSRMDEARAALQAAMVENPNCARASLILGELLASNGEHESAITSWRRIEQQAPQHAALCADKLLDSYRLLGRQKEGLKLLRSYLDKFPSIDLLSIIFRAELEVSGPSAAADLVKVELRRHPSLAGLEKLLEVQSLSLPPEKKADFELIRSLLQAHVHRMARYRCGNCGFKATRYYWICPGCGGWETYPPQRNEEYGRAN